VSRSLGVVLALFVVGGQLAGCSSCVDEPKKDPPPGAGGGTPIGERTAKITDKRPSRIGLVDAGADAP
jgi:hypothetical protein